MISEKDVLYVASLSRIHLKKDEAERLTKDLEKILDYIKKLEKLDTSNVKPTSHAIDMKDVFREDVEQRSLSQAEALKFSIEQDRGFYKVPKVIE